MNQADTAAMMTRLAEMYPKWTPEPGVIQAWRRIFYRVPDRQTAEKAIEAMWQQSKGGYPPQSLFAEIMQGFNKATHGERRPDPTTDTYLLCVEAPESVPRRLGWFLPVYLGPLHQTHSPERVHAAAERMRADHEGYYGGKFTTIQGASFEEMATLRGELRHNAGMMVANETDTQGKAMVR